MQVLVLGAGLMGRAIVYDLVHHTSFSEIIILDNDKSRLSDSKDFFSNESTISYIAEDVSDISKLEDVFSRVDIVISAVPYSFNERLTSLAINNHCHFIDLGGNNDVVGKQKEMFAEAEEANVTIIPDSGLAPGLVSILTKKLVDEFGHLSSVRLRVGGLPQHPKKPWNYQLVFSANGLINEYVEDAIILENGKIKTVSSLTQLEKICFPEPFGELEAFITSGGCSSLPLTYKNAIDYLDYKTIRYQGHLDQIKPLFDLGLDSEKEINIGNKLVRPRDVLIELLQNTLPLDGEDVVLLRVIAEIDAKSLKQIVSFEMIDYYDTKTHLSAMMRTTGFPVSITADLIASGKIIKRGVFNPEEIIPPDSFLDELGKRDIVINKKIEKNSYEVKNEWKL